MNDETTIQLNHYSIRSADLDACRRFYEGILGLAVGPRPAFPFPGLWLYAGDTASYSNAVVHIIGFDRDDPKGLEDYLGGRDPALLAGTGVVDHVAFAATGLVAMRTKLAALGIEVRERTVPSLGLQQLFLEDPNGVTIELNYPAAEAAAARS